MTIVPPGDGSTQAHRMLFRRWLSLSLAVVLPILAAALTQSLGVLRPAPYLLNFLAIVCVASLGGYVPAFVSAVLSIAAHLWFVTNMEPRGHLEPSAALRGCLLLIATGVVCAAVNSRRRSQSGYAAALSTLQERSDALIDSLHAGKCASWVLDLDSGRSARWFNGSYQVFGRPFEELEALPSLRTLLHPDDQPRLAEVAAAMRTTFDAPVTFEHRVPWPNGELHHLEMRATRVPGPGCVWRGVTVDITERILAQTALLRQEKLAAMGRLASTVAHEINNPLESVTNLLFLARCDEALCASTRAYLTTAEKELARLGDITRLTLGFVRNHSTRRRLKLESVVDEVLSIFRHRYEMKGIEVTRRFEPEIDIVIAPHELRQILTNLISNAGDALNLISPGTKPAVTVHIRCEDGNAVLLIEDNGTGIPSAVLPRIFEPFFTTKADVGTGIGLWVTRELVEQNGGRISVASGDLPPGISTRFRVELPLASKASHEPCPTDLQVLA